MASKTKSLTKAQRSINVEVPAGTSYVDLAQCLSIVNRKLFKQGMCYGVESIEFFLPATQTVDLVRLTAATAGDTWVVHNAHVKGHALWNEMNQLVLEDNPSVRQTWSDFKVFLDTAHRASYFGIGNLTPLDGDQNPYAVGEWDISDYVLPQHDVDPVTGEPLAADQTQSHLVGPDLGVPGAYLSVGLVNAYQESRTTVQPLNTPIAFQDSFFNLLTDSGSQEPELANIIQDEGNLPPYDLGNYPGGSFNAPTVVMQEFSAATIGSPIGLLTSFVAECGLIRLQNAAQLNGVTVDSVPLVARINLMPGTYKGVAAIPMGQ